MAPISFELALRAFRLVVRRVGERVGIAGVRVPVETGHVARRAEHARVAEEPQPIAHDWTAEREVRVVVLDEAWHLVDAEAPQLVVQVARLRPLAGVAHEVGAAEVVAAGSRNHVERRAAAIGLAETARDRHLDFRGVRRVVAEPGDAAAVERRSDVHAVDLDRAFVAASAACGEEVHHRIGARVETRGLNAGHRGEDVAVAARGRQRRDHVVVDHLLRAGGGVHVHDRRLARDRDGFLHAADPQVSADRDDLCTADFHALPPHGDEAGERERDGVGAGGEIFNAVLAGPVRGRGPNLLEQRWAGRFDGHAWQHGA